jgi:hypothetical protein
VDVLPISRKSEAIGGIRALQAPAKDVVWIKAPQGGILISIRGYELGRG